MLVAWQVALQEVGAPPNQSMQLTLGGTSNLWDTFLQSVLPQLAGRFPNLYIRTEINSSQELTRALLAGRVDIITVLDPPTNVDLEARRIGGLELMMVASSPNLHIEDIPNIGHVFVDWGTAFNLEQARLFNEPVAPSLHTGQAHIALEFLLSHGGAAFLPTALVTPSLDHGLLFAIEDAESATQDVHLVFSKASEKLVQFSPIITMLEELDIKPLAELVVKKTGGNPFFSIEFLKKVFGTVLGNMFFETTDRPEASRLSAFVRNSGEEVQLHQN